jgi:hypothetical protein
MAMFYYWAGSQMFLFLLLMTLKDRPDLDIRPTGIILLTVFWPVSALAVLFIIVKDRF